MVDGVLLLVDAVEGPMPQTRFVTQKAFARGLRPIVVINKIDRDGARPMWVLDQTFDLFDRLGATDEQLDFPVVYTSAIRGYASTDADTPGTDMTPLLQTIVDRCPPPEVSRDGPFQMQISSLDYSSYVGAIGIGRVNRGRIEANSPVIVLEGGRAPRRERVLQIFGFEGLERVEMDYAEAGDIIAVTGIDRLAISSTLCAPDRPEALPALQVDEPTVRMTLQVNSSPLAGREGRFLTSRQIKERLDRELIHNVALRVEVTDDPEKFAVAGRGELHLSILLENMRREGYELAVSRPRVIYRTLDGRLCEPFEELSVDIESEHQGAVMEALAARRAELIAVRSQTDRRVRLEYRIPARGLFGFQSEFLSLTSGTGLLHHVFDSYRPAVPGEIGARRNGVLVSMADGKALAYALFNLQQRGRLLVAPGDEIYEGQIVGLHARANDLVVNPMKGKQLTNIRAAGKDDNVLLTPPLRLTLERALELIDDDELVEITPRSIRLRKHELREHERRRSARLSRAGA